MMDTALQKALGGRGLALLGLWRNEWPLFNAVFKGCKSCTRVRL